MSDDIQTAADAGQQVALPQVSIEELEGILIAISTGQSPSDQLDSLQQSIAQRIIDQGGDEGAANSAAEAFTSTLQDELFNGSADLGQAADYAQQSMGRNFETYDPSSSEVSATDALFNAIASGQGIEEAVARVVSEMGDETGGDGASDAVTQAFLDELQDSLSRGDSPEQAVNSANNVAQSTSETLADASVPADPFLQALSSGGDNVGEVIQNAAQQSGGDANAFIDQLEASLAGGQEVGDALNTAGQTATEVSEMRTESQVELSAADRLAQSLASGDNVQETLQEAGGGDAFASTLENALANGAGTGDAMQQADAAQQQQNTIAEQQSVPISAADQLAASLASGDNVEQAMADAGVSGAGGDEMINQLATGADSGDAMQQAQAAQQAADSTSQQQSVPISAADQLAASLASGENVEQAMADAGVSGAGGEEMMNQLASGADTGEAMQEAAATQQSADATAQQQSVPADPAVQALAQGGDAVNDVDVSGAIADATGEVNPPSNEAAQTQTAETTSETAGQTTEAASTETGGGETETQQTPSTQSAEQTSAPAESTETAANTETTETTTTTETTETAATTETTTTETTTTETAETTSTEGGGETELTATTETAEATGTEETTETGQTEEQTQTQTAENTEENTQAAGEEATEGSTENGATEGGVTEEIQTATTGETEEDNTGQGQGQDAANQGGPSEEELDQLAQQLNEEIDTAAGPGAGGGNQGGNNTPSGPAPTFQGSLNPGPFGGNTPAPTTTTTTGGGGGASRPTRETRDNDTTTGGAGDDPIFVNTGPTANADSDAGDENETLSINVLGNDSDVDGDALTITSASVGAGRGSVTFSGNNIEFDPGADFDDLDDGDTEDITITYTISDGAGGSDSSTVTVRVTGTNDTPTLASFTEANQDEDNDFSMDLFSTANDADDSAVLSVSDGYTVVSDSGRTITEGQHFTIDQATGQISFVANEFTDLGTAAENETLTITYQVQDQFGQQSAARTATVTIQSVNDAPVITVGAGSDSATQTETDGTLLANGTLDIEDVDTSNTVSVAVTGISVVGDTNGVTDATLQNMMSVDAGDIIGAGATTGTFNWNFNSGGEAFNHLADATETIVLTYTITATDSSGGTDTHDVTVTIQGSNDAPTISVGTGDSAAETVNETDATNLTTNGTLSVGDLDESNEVTVQVTGVSTSGLIGPSPVTDATLLAMMTVDNGNIIDAGNTTGTINWSFDSGAEAFNFVGNGQSFDIAYTVQVSDGTTTSTQTVTVSVAGSNDAHSVTADIDAGNFNDNAGNQPIDLFQNVTDVDDNATFTVENLVATNSNGARALVENTHYSIDANTGFLTIHTSAFNDLDTGDASETLTFTYDVNDGQGNVVSTQAQVVIDAINDTPTVTASTNETVTNENFEAGATDWSDTTTTDLGASSSVLGRFASGGATEKTFGIPDGSGGTTISFDFFRIDTWDGEDFNVTINGTTVATRTFFHGANNDDSADAVFTAITDNSTSLAGNITQDQVFRATITLSASDIAALPFDGNGDKQLTLGFNSTLNQAVTDESWAVDNLSITATDVPMGDGSENTEIAILGVSVGDNDGEDVTVTLTANDNATISANQNGGGANITGDGTGTIVLSGSTADINTALSTLSYSGDTNFTGLGSVDIDVNDGTATRSSTIKVNVVEGDDAPVLSTAATGGAALTLNGTNSSVDIPDEVVNNTGNGMIEAWVYFDGTPNGAIFTKQHDGVNSHAILQVNSGTLSWKSHNATPTLQSNTQLQADTWHHVAINYTWAGVKMYLDGVQVGADNGNWSILDDTGIPSDEGGATIGAWPEDGGGQHMDGQIAEFRVWNVSRSQADVQNNMNTALNGDEAGLQALYNFNDTISNGSAVVDATGNFNGVSSNADSGAALNNFPIASTAPTGDEDTAIAVQNISVTDEDSASVTVTLSGPAESVLNANANGGAATVTVNGDNSAVIVGSPADVNAALQTLTFTPPANFNGTAQIAVSVADATSTVNDTVDVTVNAVADPIIVNGVDQSIDFIDSAPGTDGDDSSFSVATATGLTGFPTTSGTVELDFKTSGESVFPLFSYSDAAGSNNEFMAFYTSAGLDIWMNDARVLEDQDIGTINDGEWHHIAVSFDDAAGTGSVYIDGVVMHTFATNGTLSAGGSFAIGNDQDGAASGFERDDIFQGSIDNVRVWNDVRSGTEVADNAGNLVDSANEANLVYDWRFNDNASPTIDSKSGVAMTLQNATTEDDTGVSISEDFEGGATGWTNNTTATGTTVSEVLGPFASGHSTQKTFTLDAAASGAKFTFDVHMQDSWDNETFSVTANGTTVGSLTFPSLTGTIGEFVQTSSGVDTGVTGTHSGWDTTFAATVELTTAQIAALPTDGDGNKLLTLNFSSTLNQAINDESWAIDNLVIETNGPSEEFSTEAESIVVDLLDGVSGGEGDIDVANFSVSASDGRSVNYTLDAETGQLTIDPAQFNDLNAAGGSVGLTVSYDATDGVTSTPVTATYQVNGSQAPEITYTTGHDVVLTLDGVDDEMTLAHSDSLNFGAGDPIAVEMWIKPSNVDSLQTLISKNDSGLVDYATFRLHLDSNGNISVWNGSIAVVSAANIITEDQWQHVSFTNDGTTTTIYVNGEQVAQGAQTLGNANTDPVIIGDDNQGPRNFEGQIADIKIWDASRTQEQIQDGMQNTLSNPSAEANLVGYFNFEDGTGADRSGNDNHATLNGGASPILDTADKLVLGASQNGQTKTGDVDIDGSFSIEVFVNTTDSNTSILSHEQSAYSQPNFQIATGTSGQVTFFMREGTDDTSNGSLKAYFGTTVINNGLDHHIAVTFNDDTDEVLVYINGVLETMTANHEWAGAGTYSRTSSDGSDPHALRIGTNEKNDAALRFEGEIGEIRVWDKTLTADEVQTNMSNAVGQADDGLQHLWTFETGNLTDAVGGNTITLGSDTTVAVDELPLGSETIETGEGVPVSGQLVAEAAGGNTITSWTVDSNPSSGSLSTFNSATGDYTYQPNVGFSGADSFKVRVTDSAGNTRLETINIVVNDPPIVADHSNALALDGSSYAVVADNAALDVTTTFTLEMWVKADGAGTLISKDGSGGGDTTGAYNMALYTGSSGKLSLEYETNNSSPSLTVNDALDVGAWHHVAATFDNGNLKLYVDGTEVGSETGVPTPSDLNTNLLIGRRGFDPDPRYLNGEVDEVRIWNTAQDEAAIQANMNQELNGDEAGLAGYWTFNEASGDAIDQTANGNNAVLQNSAARADLVSVSISNNDIYKGLLLGKDANSDDLSYSIKNGPDNGTLSLDGNKFVYDHDGSGQNDSFTVEISDGTDTITEQIDITVV